MVNDALRARKRIFIYRKLSKVKFMCAQHKFILEIYLRERKENCLEDVYLYNFWKMENIMGKVEKGFTFKCMLTFILIWYRPNFPVVQKTYPSKFI